MAKKERVDIEAYASNCKTKQNSKSEKTAGQNSSTPFDGERY